MNIKTIIEEIVTRSRIVVDNSIDSSSPRLIYDLRKTNSTIEFPIGIIPFRSDIPGIFIAVDSRYSYRGLPKTALSMFKHLLGDKNYNLKPYKKDYNEDSPTLYKSVYGLILTGDSIPIIEVTRRVNVHTLLSACFVIRINRAFLDTEDPLAKYIKSSVIKLLLTEKIQDTPVELIITNYFESPLKEANSPYLEADNHRQEINRILTTNATTILGNILP